MSARAALSTKRALGNPPEAQSVNVATQQSIGVNCSRDARLSPRIHPRGGRVTKHFVNPRLRDLRASQQSATTISPYWAFPPYELAAPPGAAFFFAPAPRVIRVPPELRPLGLLAF